MNTPGFRELTRKNQELSREECAAILIREKRGVLSVLGDDDYPYGMPMNHFYSEEDGKLYFHSGMTGHKVDALRRHPKVSFCVYDSGEKEEGDWFLNIRSVIVFGRAEMITDRERIYDIAARLSRKFTDDEEYIRREIRDSGQRTLMFAVNIDHICGKLVHER